MALVIAGIDEAGYGPLLGPLCVGMAVFRVPDWEPGRPAPDLWKLLEKGVCRKPGDKQGRVAVADSKRLKLANDVKTKHPLCHLERGVLGFARCAGRAIAHDADLLAALGVQGPESDAAPWYGGEPIDLPLGCTPGELAITANRLGVALGNAGIEVLDLRCIVTREREFNETIRRTGTKGETTLAAVGGHLRHVLERWGGGPEAVRVVCDRLGGRTGYGGVLARESGAAVRVAEESDRLSRYEVGDGNVVVQFQPEAEEAHLPVALASMTAKLLRELAMMRFNRYWCGLAPELKPTAGYTQDARRWLADAAKLIGPDERAAMVRIA